jgi:DNA polymerase elongation subunit (family B)
MVQWNISPESYKGKNPHKIEDNWVKTASGAYFGPDEENPILKTIIKDLYSKRRKTKDRMLELQIEIDNLEKMVGKIKN